MIARLVVIAAVCAAAVSGCKEPAGQAGPQLEESAPPPAPSRPEPTTIEKRTPWKTTSVELADLQRVVVLAAEATLLAADVDVLAAPTKGIVGRASGGSKDGRWPNPGTRYADCTALLQVLADRPDEKPALDRRIRAARRCQRGKEVADTAAVFPLRSRCDGRVLEVLRSPGDKVDRGDPLVHIGCEGRPVIAITAADDASKNLGTITQAWLVDGPATPADAALGPKTLDLGSPIRPGVLAWNIAADHPRATPGMAVEVAVAVGVGRPGLAVPSRAVLAEKDGAGVGRAFVIVEKEGNRLERRPVTLGDRNPVFTELRTGVHAGERVVIDGVRRAEAEATAPK